MTEPSKDAVEAGKKALLDDYISNPNIPGGPILTNPHTANTGSSRVLHAALPIERERWGKEIQKRLDLTTLEALIDLAAIQGEVAMRQALATIFDKGEGDG